MTADRFGPVPCGEFTALAAAREGVRPWTRTAPATDARPDHAGQEGRRRDDDGARPSDPSRRPSRRFLPAIPPQHGAWAFLLVPVLSAFAVAGASPAGWAFCAAWVCAYPVGYYAGRGLSARVRRGSWTRLARRELRRALPWVVATTAFGAPLLWGRPWLALAAAVLGLAWALGLLVAARRGERSLANDLLLVAQAVAAVPLTVAVIAGLPAMTGEWAVATATCTVIVGAYLAGSVLHVKSLLREAGNAAYRGANVAWHAVLALAAGQSDPWWTVAFVPALARSVLLRPGLRPAAIGGVEAIVSVLVVVAAHLAL